ncbi:MAG: hypothetical protein ACLGHY_08745, partial [Gammaproteobacteria bacterium]
MKFRLDTLAKRLLVPSLALVLVATALFGTFMANRMIGILTAAAEADAARTSEFVAEVALPYITNYELSALDTLAKGLTRNPAVAHAEFLDAEGNSFTAAEVPPPANLSNLAVITRPIRDSAGKVVGTFRLAHSPEAILAQRNAILEQRNGALLTVGGGVLAVLLVLGVGLTWAVRKVLRQIGGEPEYLVAAMQRVAAGDLARAIVVRA